MSSNTSILALFFNASLVVQLVMLVLLCASIFSWTLIFQRAVFLKRCDQALENFEYKFMSGLDFGVIYNELSVKPQAELSALEAIFVVGFKEYLRLADQWSYSSAEAIKGVERALRIAFNKELDKMEHNLSFLATIQSISPFIGLFGTVWGIMHAFKELGSVQQASIAMVAPGISEALVATAMGLIAAIPAGIAYNRYVQRVDRLLNRYQIFIDEFTNTIFRQELAMNYTDENYLAENHELEPQGAGEHIEAGYASEADYSALEPAGTKIK